MISILLLHPLDFVVMSPDLNSKGKAYSAKVRTGRAVPVSAVLFEVAEREEAATKMPARASADLMVPGFVEDFVDPFYSFLYLTLWFKY